MSESTYEIILYWDKRDRIFVAEVPELPGCQAHGKTRMAAIRSAEEAIDLWIRMARQDGLEIPAPVNRQASRI